MRKLDIIVAILLVTGGINFGLIGLFDFNLVEYVVGKTWLDGIIYILMGISAVYQAIGWKSIQARCKK